MCLTNWQGQSQKTGSAGITQDILTCLQVCWEPESSQLNSPTQQGTAASGKGKLLQPERQNSPCTRARGAGCAPGGDRDTRETTPPQPSPERGSFVSAHLIPSRNHSNALELSALGTPCFQHESKALKSCRALSGKTPDRPHHSETNTQKVINKCKKRRQRTARVFGSSGRQGCPP